MDFSILQLHLAQANKSLQRARNNNYSDQEKQEYQDCLISLYEKASTLVAHQTNPSNSFIQEIKQHLDFIYKSLEFLDSSTLNLIPFETVEGLKIALSDWIKPDEKFIIVTSLINEIDGFSFDNQLVEVEPLYDLFNKKYGVNFTSRLVQINIPRALSRDYLASVVHYHELGHFVDTKNAITDSLQYEILSDWNKLGVGNPERNKYLKYFPYLDDPQYSSSQKLDFIYFHIGEYFCDLFASQYIGDSLNAYLSYITEDQKNYSETHPSSINRSDVVNDFLSRQSNLVVDIVNNGLQQILSMQLAIRFEKPMADDFYNFIPTVVENNQQLHGLLLVAWNVWQSDWKQFQQNMQMGSPPTPDRIYSVINNLVEKAIGNYIVTSKWKANI